MTQKFIIGWVAPGETLPQRWLHLNPLGDPLPVHHVEKATPMERDLANIVLLGLWNDNKAWSLIGEGSRPCLKELHT